MINLKGEISDGASNLKEFITNTEEKPKIEVILKQESDRCQENKNDGMTMEELIGIIWRKMWLIILCAILGGGIIYFITSRYVTPTYESSISMYVNNNSERTKTDVDYSDINISKELVPTYMQILKSNTILDQVINYTELEYTREEMQEMIKTNALANTEIFIVKVISQDPEHAAVIANAIAELSPDEIMRITRAGSVEVIDYAEVATKPSSPNIIFNTIVGIMLGGILSVFVVLIIDKMDTRIKDEKQLQNIIGAPLLGEIPLFEKTPTRQVKQRKKS